MCGLSQLSPPSQRPRRLPIHLGPLCFFASPRKHLIFTPGTTQNINRFFSRPFHSNAFLALFFQRRSGHDRRDVQILTLDERNRGDGASPSRIRDVTDELNATHGSNQVDVLNLDEADRGGPVEHFRKDGGTEILLLDSPGDARYSEDYFHDEVNNDAARPNTLEESSVKINLEDYDEMVTTRTVGIDHGDEGNEGMTFEAHRSRKLAAVREETATAAAAAAMEEVEKEDKMIQTTAPSYLMSKSSKKCQTIHLDESDSDDDQDLANQSLSQSMMSALQGQGLGYSKSFNDPGFLNVAMHTLVRDQIKNNGTQNLPSHPSHRRSTHQHHHGHLKDHHEEEDELDRSHRSLLSYPGRTYSRHSEPPTGAQLDRMSEREMERERNSEDRKYSRRRGYYNYYNGNRSPGSPTYTETKASILRRRTVNARPQEMKLSKKRSNALGKFNSASLNDISNLTPRTLDGRKSSRTLSRNTSTPEGLDRHR